jgi:hypothetical protein
MWLSLVSSGLKMANANPIFSSFNAGELSPTLDGRVDLQKYGSGCKKMENFLPLVQGPARRRSGTYFAEEVKDSNDRTWLLPFEFSESQAYILEFGDRYIRFFTNYGQVQTGTLSAWVTSTAYAVGDLVAQGGVNYYCQVAHTSGTFSTDLSAGNWYALTGTVYEIPTPYTLADLTASNNTLRLRWVQSADVIYIVHPNYPPKKLSRFSATRWTLTNIEFFGGPFEDVDPDAAITVYGSAETGSITLTASAALFASSDVGSLFLLEQKSLDGIAQWEVAKTITAGARRRSDGKTYEALTSGTTGTVKPLHSAGAVYDGDPGVQWAFRDPGYGWVKITGFTSSTVVSATVLSRLPSGAVGSGNATNRWAFGKWSSTRGWPSQVTFFRERLCFATEQDIDLSVAGDYENFADRDDGGQVVADQAISVEVASGQVNKVEWLAPSDGLLIGTAGAEFVLGEVTTDQPLGPDNVKITQQSTYGSRSVIPLLVGESVLFIQRAGQKLRELIYDFGQNGFKSSDLTVLAEHITFGGVTSLAYQQEPHSIIWLVRDDGQLLGFTFNREQDVLGWHRHILGGSGVVESIATIPSPFGDQDDLWMIVKRTIDGVTKRYVEYLWTDFDEDSSIEDAFFVDSGLTYDGSPVTTLSGLDHLDGEEVAILADGATHPNRTVASGEITLQLPASVVHVGLPFGSTLKTMRPEAGATSGTAQGKTKRITDVKIRFLATLGAKAGPDENTLDEIQFRSGSDQMDAPPPVFTGDKEIEWPNGYDSDGFIVVKQEQPLPMTVVAIMPELQTQE